MYLTMRAAESRVSVQLVLILRFVAVTKMWKTSFTVALLALLFAFFTSLSVYASQNPRAFPFDDPNQVGVAQTDSSPQAPTRQFSSPDGRRVLIHDKAVDEEQLKILDGLQIQVLWGLHHNDGRRTDCSERIRGGNAPWSGPIDSYNFAKSKLGSSLRNLLIAAYQRDLHAYDVRFLAFRRGDDTTVDEGASQDDNEVWSMVHTASSRHWKGDAYGEMLFFDDEREVIGAAAPKFRRVVSWDASIPHLNRPPSVNHTQAQILLLVRWTGNQSKVAEWHRAQENYNEETRNGVANGLFTSGSGGLGDGDVDVGAHETQRFRTRKKKQVVVFDNLLDKADLDALRRYCKRYAHFFFSDYATSGDEGSDNVQWIGAFETKLFVQSKYWKIIQKIVKYVSGGHAEWYPYDVAVNIIRSADHTRIHGDVRNDEDDEWTLLIYLSPEWESGSYGETAWFTEESTWSNEMNIETEVQPVYGRIAIFEGLIGHAARPPSPDYRGPRYSFAVKMAKTKWMAMRNMLDEEFHEKTSIVRHLKQTYVKEKVAWPQDKGDPASVEFARKYWKLFEKGSERGCVGLIDSIKESTQGDGDQLEGIVDVMVASLQQRRDLLGQKIMSLL